MKKHILHSVVIIVLFPFFFACTKLGKNITVTGRILNPITGEGFEGIEVQLQKIGKGLPAGYETVKETNTDSDGHFEINHLGGASGYLILPQTTTEMYRVGWYVEGEYKENSQLSVPKGKKMNVDYHAVPYGKFSLDINNINCGGGGDTIIINQQNQIGSLLDIDWVLEGCAGYTTAMQKTPMGWIYIYWTVIRSGIAETFSDSIYIGEGQDVVYTLDY